MKLTIDFEKRELVAGDKTLPLYSREGFELVSDAWLKLGWNQKYVYTFSWFGRPVIQLPEDMVRIQEVIWSLQPTAIVETGVAHGGSLIFYASLLKGMGLDDSKVVGIDIEIRKHNRKAIEEHPLFPYITLIEGSSVAEDIVAKVRATVAASERTLVLLDSNHSADHVYAELLAYAPLVTPGSYIVATDGIMDLVQDVPRAGENWGEDNPITAVKRFLQTEAGQDFTLEQPPWPFNESELRANVTHWPSAYLRRRSPGSSK
jgi:cephalosporin hydroxylase